MVIDCRRDLAKSIFSQSCVKHPVLEDDDKQTLLLVLKSEYVLLLILKEKQYEELHWGQSWGWLCVQMYCTIVIIVQLSYI